jgi:hypothetical protein
MTPFLALFLLLPPQSPVPDAASGALLDQRELQAACARLASEHPREATILPLVESAAGRRVDIVRIARGELKPGRPAVLVVAGLDGPLAWTSGVALEAARGLLASKDANTRRLLAQATLYIVPRADPDACEARFAIPLSESRAIARGGDDDRDGTEGEDAPGDVDGDGLVLRMRVPDPDGEWLVDPRDPRAMRRRDASKGEIGTHRLMPEGRDGDRDELAGEDPLLDVVLNRNFPQGWREHDLESGAWPTSLRESRALCDFVLAHPEIVAVVAYGELDNCAERPKVRDEWPRRSPSPSEGIPAEDADAMALLVKRSSVKFTGRSAGSDAGTFQAWVQSQRGLWSFNANLWSMPLDAEAPKVEGAPEPPPDLPEPGDDAKRLRWIDREKELTRFVPWRAFQHPDLGRVEVGGFAPYALVEPPQADRARIAVEQERFLAALLAELPRPRVARFAAKDLGAGLLEVELELRNDALLATRSRMARRTGGVRPLRVRLDLPSEATRLAGPAEAQVDLDGSGGKAELTWLVRGIDAEDLVVEIEGPQFVATRVEMEQAR